jgi:hypothetical protein
MVDYLLPRRREDDVIGPGAKASMEQCTECRLSKWRDEGKAFFEIKSGFQEKTAFFGVSAPASPSSTRSMTALAQAHLQLFSHLLFTPSVNHPERVVDAPPGASVIHQRRCTAKAQSGWSQQPLSTRLAIYLGEGTEQTLRQRVNRPKGTFD